MSLLTARVELVAVNAAIRAARADRRPGLADVLEVRRSYLRLRLRETKNEIRRLGGA